MRSKSSKKHESKITIINTVVKGKRHACIGEIIIWKHCNLHFYNSSTNADFFYCIIS